VEVLYPHQYVFNKFIISVMLFASFCLYSSSPVVVCTPFKLYPNWPSL